MIFSSTKEKNKQIAFTKADIKRLEKNLSDGDFNLKKTNAKRCAHSINNLKMQLRAFKKIQISPLSSL